MARTLCLIVVVCSFTFAELRGQSHDYSVGIFGSLNTSVKLFNHPDDQDVFLRSQFVPLDNIFSGGIDVRRTFETIHLTFGLSFEYLSTLQLFTHALSDTTRVSVRDGFTIIPVEASVYFPIPVGNDDIQLYMGGGGGAYFGKLRHEFAGARSEPVDRTAGVGIHIVSGLEYQMRRSMSLRAEMKFRNVQFEGVDRFSQSYAVSGGEVVALPQEPQSSRVSIDGITATLQIVYHF